MRLNKRINAEIPQEQENLVIQHIKDTRDILAFLVNLNSNERIRMAKLSRGRVDFVDTSLVHVIANPEYFPAYVSVEEFAKDMALRESLHRIRAELSALTERIDDTILLTDSEAYRASRLFYKSVKAAAKEGAEDAERIAKELAYHYKKQGVSKNGSAGNSTAQENQE